MQTKLDMPSRNAFAYNLDASSVMLGRISYMNVAPVYYGLDNGLRPAWLKIVTAPPAVLNHMLQRGALDISPVSIAAYAANQKDWLLLPDLSISCTGEVMSVILVSSKPLKHLHRRDVFLTDESSTAAELLKLLLAMQGAHPRYSLKAIRKPEDISGRADAALVIGDAALNNSWSRHFQYVWDLGAMWRNLTGLPFVFAVWAVRRRFAERKPHILTAVCDYFQRSRSDGRAHVQEIAARASLKLGVPSDVCEAYYNKLSYDLDALKIQGAQRFFKELQDHGILNEPVSLTFS